MIRQFTRAALFTLGAVASFAIPLTVQAQAEPIRIGFLTVRTGPLAAGGRQMEQGIELFLKERNNTIAGRKVGILIDDGSDAAAIKSVKVAVEKAGGKSFIVAPRLKNIKTTAGSLDADGQLAGSPSCTFDAIALVLTPEAAAKLCREAAAVQFVMDAFGHLKAIGHDRGATSLLDKAGVETDAGVTDLGSSFIKAAGQRFYDREPNVRTLA